MTSQRNFNSSLDPSEIDKLFSQYSKAGVSRGGKFTPTFSTVNSNNTNNKYNVKRDDNKDLTQQTRELTLQRDQKVNGAMAHGQGINVRGGAKKTSTKEKKEKPSLKKETSDATNLKWLDFIAAIRKEAPDLKMKDHLKIGSAMKKGGMYSLDNVNQQTIATILEQLK